MERDEQRPLGEIKIYDPRGYAYFPKILRNELNVKGVGKIPYYVNANCVLLVRKDATRRDVLEGLDLLKNDLKLRWKKNEKEAPKG